MNVLVTAASRHGATAEIGERIGSRLRERGHVVQVMPPDRVVSLDGVSAVVLGSAVYLGRWLRPARRFSARYAGDLTGRLVWLFSSGPIGDPPFPEGQPSHVADLVIRSGAREHRVFSGRLDRSLLGPAEQVVVRTARVPSGDFRDWAAIDAWAYQIADALEAEGRPLEATL